MRLRIYLVLLPILSACITTGNSLTARDAWARPALSSSSGGANITAVYFTVENRGKSTDQLIAVTTTIADTAELHQTQTGSGLAGMRQVDFVEIPPNSAVKFRPGGYHVMLTALKQDLVIGQSFTLTLQFQSGRQFDVEVNIREDPP